MSLKKLKLCRDTQIRGEVMTVEIDNSELIKKLIRFGLNGEETQLYFHLLKFGPTHPSLLAKSLKTYREDIHCALTALIDKGMVKPSPGSPAVYEAVELETALDAALKTHEAKLRGTEMKKQEIQRLSEQQRFSPSDEFVTYKHIKFSKTLNI